MVHVFEAAVDLAVYRPLPLGIKMAAFHRDRRLAVGVDDNIVAERLQADCQVRDEQLRASITCGRHRNEGRSNKTYAHRTSVDTRVPQTCRRPGRRLSN